MNEEAGEEAFAATLLARGPRRRTAVEDESPLVVKTGA